MELRDFGILMLEIDWFLGFLFIHFVFLYLSYFSRELRSVLHCSFSSSLLYPLSFCIDVMVSLRRI